MWASNFLCPTNQPIFCWIFSPQLIFSSRISIRDVVRPFVHLSIHLSLRTSVHDGSLFWRYQFFDYSLLWMGKVLFVWMSFTVLPQVFTLGWLSRMKNKAVKNSYLSRQKGQKGTLWITNRIGFWKGLSWQNYTGNLVQLYKRRGALKSSTGST